MSFPSPQAKLIHYNMAQEILEDAELNGVVLESEEGFVNYRDDFVKQVFLDPASPRYRMSWSGVGVRANFNRNSITYWRASNRERLVEDEKNRLREIDENLRRAHAMRRDALALADGAVAEILATDLTTHTNESVYAFFNEVWCREKGCDIKSFAKTKQFRMFQDFAFRRLNEAVADAGIGEDE